MGRFGLFHLLFLPTVCTVLNVYGFEMNKYLNHFQVPDYSRDFANKKLQSSTKFDVIVKVPFRKKSPLMKQTNRGKQTQLRMLSEAHRRSQEF